MQPRYIQYSTYNVKLSVAGGEEVIRHDLAVYGARDAEKVIVFSSFLAFGRGPLVCWGGRGGWGGRVVPLCWVTSN